MQYGERRWPQVPESLEKVVVLPLGSLEQHGRHLPMLTDTLIIQEIARRAESELGEEALFLPPLWVGASDHHLGFPGTVSIANEHYALLIEDILESLVKAGFRRIFLLNGHGGNIILGRQAAYNVHLRHQDLEGLYLAFSNWWTLAADQVAAIEGLGNKMVSHACEQESSLVLCLRPDLPAMEEASGAQIPFDSAFYSPDYSAPGRVDVARAFHQASRTGAFGHPELASAEKGERILAAVVPEVVAFIREFRTWPIVEPA